MVVILYAEVLLSLNGYCHLTFAILERVYIAHWEPVAYLVVSRANVKVQTAEVLVHHTFVDVAFLAVNDAAVVEVDALLAAADEEGVNAL